MNNIFEKSNAKPIWINQNKVNQYVDFKVDFQVDEIFDDAKFYISVDTEYALFINGSFVDAGAYDDFPNNKSYDVLDVAKYLKAGKNNLLIMGYSQGTVSFQYITGTPFIIFYLENGKQIIKSDENVFCRENPNYKSGDIPKISFQMAYSFEYNANNSESNYESAILIDKEKIAKNFFLRPIKKCVFENHCNCIIKSQGKLIRKDKNAQPAQNIKADYLSFLFVDELFENINTENRCITSKEKGNVTLYSAEKQLNSYVCFKGDNDNDGVYLLLDLENMQTGLLELELDAESETVVDIAYGECIDDLRVRTGCVQTAGRYICKKGHQKFIHYMKRLGGRYLQLHFTNIKGDVILYYCGIIPMVYPVKENKLEMQDRLLNKIYDVAVRTLKMCMHEHYEDCPIREQGLYGFDSLIQMICGYYAFSETEMPKASIRLMAEGQNEKGLISLCTPTVWHETIPIFSISWVLGLEKYYDFTKDKEFLEEMIPAFERIINAFLGWLDNGLIKTPFIGNEIWNFYDWEYGLEDSEHTSKINEGKTRFDAPLNFAFCMMMKSAIKLFGALGKETKEFKNAYDTVKENSHKIFYNEEKGLYVTYVGGTFKEHYCELSQALAVISGVNDDVALTDKLADKFNGLIKTNLSLMYYKYEALMTKGNRYFPFMLDEIAEIWGNMVYKGAATFWETSRGEDDFNKAASLCHGWSAIPIYVFGKYLS